MALTACTESPAGFRKAGARPHVLEHGEQPEEQSCKKSDGQRESEYGKIDVDVAEARKARRGDGDEKTQSGPGKTQTQNAAEDSDKEALAKQLRSDAAAACAQRGANGKFLAAAFGAHKHKISDVGAGDEQNHTDTAHEHPKEASDVADDFTFERNNLRGEAGFEENIERISGLGWKTAQSDGNQTCSVGGGLRDSRVWIEPREAEIEEVADLRFIAIQLKRHDEREVPLVKKTEGLRQDADDAVRAAVDDEGFADDGRIAAEIALPVAVGQDSGERRVRSVVRWREKPPERGGNTQCSERVVGYVESLNVLWLRRAGDVGSLADVKADGLEAVGLVAKNEIVLGRHVVDEGIEGERANVDGDELLGMRVRERLEQNPFDDAENCGVGADAEGEG